MRDRTAMIATESLILSVTCGPRVLCDSRQGIARFGHVPSQNSSQITHEGGA
jgi:hypothetical protein